MVNFMNVCSWGNQIIRYNLCCRCTTFSVCDMNCVSLFQRMASGKLKTARRKCGASVRNQEKWNSKEKIKAVLRWDMYFMEWCIVFKINLDCVWFLLLCKRSVHFCRIMKNQLRGILV